MVQQLVVPGSSPDDVLLLRLLLWFDVGCCWFLEAPQGVDFQRDFQHLILKESRILIIKKVPLLILENDRPIQLKMYNILFYSHRLV